MNDRLKYKHTEEWDGEAVAEARQQRYVFLEQYSTDGLREIYMVVQFLQKLHDSLFEVSDPDLGVTREDFDDFSLACGPIAYLECYEEHNFSPLEGWSRAFNWEMFAGFLSHPLKRIMDARKIVLEDDDWKVILDNVPSDGQATCDRCHTMKGFELYDENNYENLWISPLMAKFVLPRLFKGELLRHCTEGALIAAYFWSLRFSYADFLDEIFAYSTPIPPARKEQHKLSLDDPGLADTAGTDIDAGSSSDIPPAHYPNPTSAAAQARYTTGSYTAGPWDGLTTSNALCADCIQGFVIELLPQWWVDRRRKGGATIPEDKCCYGWNCSTMTRDPSHAMELNHFCKPSGSESA